MSLPVSVPYAFANATTTQNLSSLDSNFNALANGLNGLANGSSQISVSSISATGTANSNTYLRGDGAWATVSGGGSDVTYANVTVTQNLVPPSSFLRNRIINGAMMIDQRNAGAAVTNGSGAVATYPVDRWTAYGTQASKFTAQQNAGSVALPSGFTNYLGATSSSAYAVLSTDSFCLYQRIEGLNVYDLGWGAAGAVTVTLSFWVRSSLTGTHSGALQNSAQNRSYVFTFTVNSANTWEYKTITIAGDTTGTWLTTNGTGIGLYFNMGSGTSASTTAGVWTAGVYFGATGAQSVVGTNGATFYITGVQLEVGSVATPFERRQYGQELMLCQRYYYKTYDIGTVPGTASAANGIIATVSTGTAAGTTVANCQFPISMRTAPTVTFYSYSGASGSWRQSSTGTDVSVGVYLATGERGTQIYNTAVMPAAQVGLYGHVVATAEL